MDNGRTLTQWVIDARPDFAPWSTDLRMESSVESALGHIHSFMHPQLYLIDDAASEELFFVKAIRRKAYDTQKSIIELPADAVQRLMWITRLDHRSLQGEARYPTPPILSNIRQHGITYMWIY